jgi:hypothetical protein
MAGIDRNQWPLSIGIGGRLRPEYARLSKISKAAWTILTGSLMKWKVTPDQSRNNK